MMVSIWTASGVRGWARSVTKAKWYKLHGTTGRSTIPLLEMMFKTTTAKFGSDTLDPAEVAMLILETV